MSTPLTPAVYGMGLTTTLSTIYTVPTGNTAAGIDAACFNNYSSSNVDITVRLVQVGTSSELDELITTKTIRAGENYLAPSLIGQSLVEGGTIEASASANSSVSVNITVTLV